MLALSLTHAQRANAWGNEGHAVIGEIAEAHLTPRTQVAVRDLLALDNYTHLAEVASWADYVRMQRRYTSPWHFVDIPLDSSAYDAARDCPHDDCVVARIDLFAAVLADRNANARTRVEALKFVTHFVGDVHQPLHAEDHNDKGGNRIRVANYPGHASLHSIWDTDMIEADDSDAHALARRLDASISNDDVRRWQAGSPSDWANESHALAVTAYALLGTPSAGAEISIPDSYVVTERPVIELQLKRAGIRLAMVLNRALDR
jgi:hypothetical protein